jgi:hypothetical protein
VAKVNPLYGMESSGPRVSGKISTPLSGVVFCLKNLPYPFSDLLECRRNETNGDRNTQKKNEGFTEFGLDSTGTHFTAPESA